MKLIIWSLKLIPLVIILGFTCLIFNEKKLQSTMKNPTSITNLFRVTEITDGDTIHVVNTQGTKLKIRFCGIDAPEKSQPLGDKATKFLEELVKESEYKVSVAEIKQDRYGRIVAEIFTLLPDGSEKFLNEEMVNAGLAYHYKRYSGSCPNKVAIENAEAIAQSNKVGVWGGKYEKPWEYRRKKRSKK